MSFFDSFKNQHRSEGQSGFSGNTGNIGNGSVKTATNKTVTFTFNALPKTLSELQSLPESDLSTPFKTAALTVLALARFNDSPEDSFAMLDWLNGPNELNNFTKQFIKEHLGQKQYLINSYFNGTSPENGYTPSMPYSITVSDNPYSYQEENWATMWIVSTGADSPRQIKMRLKPSTAQWFLNEQFLLAGIRIPKEADPWA